jgi:hypothetical protein
MQPLAADLTLHPHPGQSISPDLAVTANLQWRNGQLALSYRIVGPLATLRLPRPAAAPQRRDGLWQHTCCEIFIAAADTPAYVELNFSPGGDWAAYAFSGYRQPAQLPQGAPPSIATQAGPDGFSLLTAVDANFLPAAPRWHVGLSCVLEDINGQRSYWALKHAGEQPDFHLRESFVLTLTC